MMTVMSGLPSSAYLTSSSGPNFFCGTCRSGLYGEYVDPSHPFVIEGRHFSVRVGTFDERERESSRE
jgi:hypothetical protein